MPLGHCSNVVAWMKLRPFLCQRASRIFIGTDILAQPYWIVEIYASFCYFHNVNKLFLKTRPWETLFRDPWWVVATVYLFYNIKARYDLTLCQMLRVSPRFAIMLSSMILSIIFIILDVLSVTPVLSSSLPIGVNPFWKLSFVFKCLTDSVILDDFKTALDQLHAYNLARFHTGINSAIVHPFELIMSNYCSPTQTRTPAASSWERLECCLRSPFYRNW